MALKTNIRTVENSLSIINNIKGVNFDWIDNGRSSIGVLAQDIEAVAPSLVNTNQGFKTVNYNGIIGILVQAVNELTEKIQQLEGKK
jgi:hypothetical protein